MKSLDSSHDHDLDLEPGHGASAPRDRLARRIARKPLDAATSSDAVTPRASAWSFADAVNVGIHGPIARRASGDGLHADAAERVTAAAGSSGSALPSTLQRKFEASLGADLSGVRIHTGETSAQASSAISARAYTVGQDVHFGAGQYDPSSSAGEHLIAHEVAHTVQQAGAASSPQCKLEVSEPGDACEYEADSAADAMVAGRPFEVASAGGVQRKILRVPGEGGTEPGSEAPRTAETDGGGGGGGDGTGGGGDGTGGGGGPTQLQTTWTIDYDRVYRGERRSGGRTADRTPRDALRVQGFRVVPEGRPTAATFDGYDLAPNGGPVTMGTAQHPQGVAGDASCTVSYLRAGQVTLRASGDRAALRQFGGRRQIAERVRGAVETEELVDDARATAALTPEERAAGITMTATSREGRDTVTVNPLPLHYPAIARDGQAMNVMVTVPTGDRRVMVDDTGREETEVTDGDSDGRTHRDEAGVDTTTTTETRLAGIVERNYEAAVQQFSRDVSSRMFTERLELSNEFEIGGEATGGFASEASTELSAGDIIALLAPEAAPLAELLGDLGPSLSLAIRPDFHMTARARNQTTMRGELTAEQREEHERTLQTTITRGLMQRWETELRTTVTTNIRVAHSDERRDDRSHSERTETSRTHETRSEGDAESQRGTPRLVLTNTPAAAEAPRLPRRVE